MSDGFFYLQKLAEGNERFIAGKAESHNFYNKRFDLIDFQRPYVAILGCSDSRVPLEIIFDQNFGNLFVIRNPGNMADNHTIGSLEFAVEVLKIKLILIMGHQSCGMINIALKNKVSENRHLNRIISNAKKFINFTGEESSAGFDVDYYAQRNILNNIIRIKTKSKIISESIFTGSIALHGGFYNLENGKVDFYEENESTLLKINL